MSFDSLSALLHAAAEQGCSLGEAVLKAEAESLQLPEEQLFNQMTDYLQVMRSAISRGLTEEIRSLSGLSGGAAKKFDQVESPRFLSSLTKRAMSYALAVIEVNAAMGKVVAAPTAGSSGILPGVILAIADELNVDEAKLVLALFTGAGIGQIIGQMASLSGAEGGCQAECGSAGAMAAAAAVEIAGGSPQQALEASALALKSSLGLVCDPVAGLVEVPCVKRNAMHALTALGAAELALAGIESVIPMDEVIDAMGQIGHALPRELRETALGGLAQTKTAQELTKRIFQQE